MPMLPTPQTLGALLAHLPETLPAHEALVWPPQRLTYAALYAQATTMAAGLWRLGIRPDEPVALLMSNRPAWLITAWGCALLGAPLVAISTWSRRVELAQLLEHARAVALVTMDRPPPGSPSSAGCPSPGFRPVRARQRGLVLPAAMRGRGEAWRAAGGQTEATRAVEKAV